jgi:hypothetical protein
MRDSWYYSVPEGQIGPITLEELKETLPNLPNAKDVYIWHDSLPDWIRAGDLAEIVANGKMTASQAQGFSEDSIGSESQDAAEETRWDPESLAAFHPDPTLAITAPASAPADTAVATSENGRRVTTLRMLVGVVLVVLGGGLFFLGIAGLANWVTRAFGFTNAFVDASPGAVLFVVGVLVIWGGRRKLAAD